MVEDITEKELRGSDFQQISMIFGIAIFCTAILAYSPKPELLTFARLRPAHLRVSNVSSLSLHSKNKRQPKNSVVNFWPRFLRPSSLVHNVFRFKVGVGVTGLIALVDHDAPEASISHPGSALCLC